MKRILALLLALMLVFSCTACSAQPADGTTQSAATEQTEPEVNATLPQVTVENPATYFSLSISDDSGEYRALTAYDDGQGMAYLEYVGDIRKVATFDLSVLHAITAELENSGLVQLNGTNAEGEGGTYASMYVSYADEGYLGAGYTGTVAQEFMDGYEIMDAYFQALMAAVPEYVPQPAVMGEVNADALAAVMEVLENSGMEPLDMFVISDVPTTDVYTAGLTDAAGITNITSCGPMMMATAYSFVIATVEEESAIDAVRQDFADNLDWNRWVCVSAETALIAQKDNMVVCVMASGDLYQKTADAIVNAGWTQVETVENPAM